MSKKEKYKVFLITWEGTVYIPEKDKIAIVSNIRHINKIKLIMEALYSSKYYSIEEQLGMAKYNKRSKNPYPVETQVIETECGDITKRRVVLICGANPWLEGRVVENFHIKHNAKGEVSHEWDEKK